MRFSTSVKKSSSFNVESEDPTFCWSLNFYVDITKYIGMNSEPFSIGQFRSVNVRVFLVLMIQNF